MRGRRGKLYVHGTPNDTSSPYKPLYCLSSYNKIYYEKALTSNLKAKGTTEVHPPQSCVFNLFHSPNYMPNYNPFNAGLCLASFRNAVFRI